MLDLSNVTLCCVDTSHHVLSSVALKRCEAVAQFAKVVFITDRADHVAEGWEFHRICPFDFDEYNHFMLKSLYNHIDTEFVLSVQFDGFIINPEAWTDEFLSYDYIGAPWGDKPKEAAVGNGGFSLRSRKLLKALQDDRIMRMFPNEDACISAVRNYLEIKHGVRIAPLELASRFSYETGPLVESAFGFHGLDLLFDVFRGELSAPIFANLQPYLLKNAKALNLVIKLWTLGRETEIMNFFKWASKHITLEELNTMLTGRGASPEIMEFFNTSWRKYVG